MILAVRQRGWQCTAHVMIGGCGEVRGIEVIEAAFPSTSISAAPDFGFFLASALPIRVSEAAVIAAEQFSGDIISPEFITNCIPVHFATL